MRQFLLDATLNDKLEPVVLPLRYASGEDASGSRQIMQDAVSKNASHFNGHRMRHRYATDSYRR